MCGTFSVSISIIYYIVTIFAVKCWHFAFQAVEFTRVKWTKTQARIAFIPDKVSIIHIRRNVESITMCHHERLFILMNLFYKMWNSKWFFLCVRQSASPKRMDWHLLITKWKADTRDYDKNVRCATYWCEEANNNCQHWFALYFRDFGDGTQPIIITQYDKYQLLLPERNRLGPALTCN